MDASQSFQLNRDSRLADRIYKAVVAQFGKDVSVADIEQRFKFRWREVDVPLPLGGVRREDPYYAQLLSKSICDSFYNLLFALPHRLSALPGLSPTQTIEVLRPQLNHAVNLLYNRLGPYLAGTVAGATHERLVHEAQACATELVALHTQSTRQLISEQTKGLQVLQGLCSEAMEDKPVAEILFKHADVLQVLATQPPHQLIDELNRERIPFAELADFLILDARQDVRGAACLPPSGATRELAVQQWAKRYGSVVQQCLVPVRQSLSVLSTAADGSCIWHGVIVAHKTDMVVSMAIQTGGPMAALPCTPATHTHELDNLMLVATSTSDPVSLLIPRLVRVVTHLIENRHLSVRKVRADALLPLVSRWNYTAVVRREQIMAQSISQFEQDTGSQFPVEDDSASDYMEDAEPAGVTDGGSTAASEATTASTFPEAVGVNPQLQYGPHMVMGTVPLSLERDHAIVVCIRDLLRERGGTASTPDGIFVLQVKAVVSRVLLRAYDMLRASERSTSQSVGWVYTKIVQHHSAKTGINYYKTDQHWKHEALMSKPKGAGLVLDAQGLDTVVAYLDWAIEQMRTNGTAFAKAWFPSRSARSHSRRSLWQRRNGARGETGPTEDSVGVE